MASTATPIHGNLDLNAPSPKVILSYGLGVDSSAILANWLHHPSSRDFDLKDLVVITAMTGDEFVDTHEVVTTHMLPLMREHGVRFIQVARAGRLEEDGIVVLDDSRSPQRLYTEGAFKLSDELRHAATVPQYANGRRQCSIKFKGWVLDLVIETLTRGKPFRHVMGFNADPYERDVRAKRDSSYSTVQRKSEYPLIEWGATRSKCEAYLFNWTGIEWPKSCCVMCPFFGSQIDRYKRIPSAGIFALGIEHMSLAMNPRMGLYSHGNLRDKIDPSILSLFEQGLHAEPEWTLYRVRRAYRAKGKADRHLELYANGTREEMTSMLRRMGTPERVEGSDRVYIHRRQSDVYPTAEEMFVLAPSGADEKEGNIEVSWAKATAEDEARRRGATINWTKRAKSFLRSYGRENETFTKTAARKAARPYGLSKDDVDRAWLLMETAEQIVKKGRRYSTKSRSGRRAGRGRQQNLLSAA